MGAGDILIAQSSRNIPFKEGEIRQGSWFGKIHHLHSLPKSLKYDSIFDPSTEYTEVFILIGQEPYCTKDGRGRMQVSTFSDRVPYMSPDPPARQDAFVHFQIER
jgi:hypothetical protein